MPNGWKKNAAYVGENANSHQEYLDEKNKFRKWKKNNKVNCYWDTYDCYHTEPRACNRYINPWFRLETGVKWDTKNTENTCYTKFIRGINVYSNEANSRYHGIKKKFSFERHYNKTNHQYKPHTLKKNYNQVNVSAKKNTKTPSKFVDISHECVVCLENNWEHRMKKLVCKKRQSNSNYICKKCAEQISNYGERKCPLCRSHWI